MKITKKGFYDLIQIERDNQDAKWGEQHHTDEKWALIILEELGEAAKALNDGDEANFLAEIVQVSALIENWVTSRTFFDKDEKN